MKYPEGWEKRLLITLFITVFLFFMTQTPAVAFGPVIVDVTTKAFSVVWTTGGPYTSSYFGINLYESDFSTPNTEVKEEQIFVETDPNFSGEAGRQHGLAKVTVVGLDIDTVYYFRLTQNDIPFSDNYPVRTAKLRGFETNDPNNSDIVSNDIVHKAVYQSDGTSPAIGALVVADIYEHNVNPDTNPNDTKSYYPITAWVGDGMIGDDDDSISYKQYAALNMNNLFEKDSHYPLSLHGDDPNTSTNESEIIKFTIVHGTQPILGGTGDAFTSYGRVEYIEKASGVKITTGKVSASFKFKAGVNMFAFPFIVTDGYKTGDLLEAIEEAEGTQVNEEGKVGVIYSFINNAWTPTIRVIDPFFGTYIDGSKPVLPGKGYFIIMKEAMSSEVSFYGEPESVLLDLSSGKLNLISLPQLPVELKKNDSFEPYETGDLFEAIESSSGAGEDSVSIIYFFENNAWSGTVKVVDPFFGTYIDRSKVMSNTNFYFVGLKSTADNVIEWDPIP